jgi:DNA repair exonuclease SbcCD ATPase subunit
MVEKAMRDQILDLERTESQRINKAVKAAEELFAADKKALKEDKKELKEELAKIRKNVFEDPKTLEAALCATLGIKKLQPKHWKAVAEATGKQVVVNKKTYEPYTEEERVESDERIRQTSAVTRALETVAAAPSPQSLRPMVFEAQLVLHRQVAGKVSEWMAEYAALLMEG